MKKLHFFLAVLAILAISFGALFGCFSYDELTKLSIGKMNADETSEPGNILVTAQPLAFSFYNPGYYPLKNAAVIYVVSFYDKDGVFGEPKTDRTLICKANTKDLGSTKVSISTILSNGYNGQYIEETNYKNTNTVVCFTDEGNTCAQTGCIMAYPNVKCHNDGTCSNVQDIGDFSEIPSCNSLAPGSIISPSQDNNVGNRAQAVSAIDEEDNKAYIEYKSIITGNDEREYPSIISIARYSIFVPAGARQVPNSLFELNLCLPVFLLFGLLFAGMFMTGNNPFFFFDVSAIGSAQAMKAKGGKYSQNLSGTEIKKGYDTLANYAGAKALADKGKTGGKSPEATATKASSSQNIFKKAASTVGKAVGKVQNTVNPAFNLVAKGVEKVSKPMQMLKSGTEKAEGAKGKVPVLNLVSSKTVLAGLAGYTAGRGGTSGLKAAGQTAGRLATADLIGTGVSQLTGALGKMDSKESLKKQIDDKEQKLVNLKSLQEEESSKSNKRAKGAKGILTVKSQSDIQKDIQKTEKERSALQTKLKERESFRDVAKSTETAGNLISFMSMGITAMLHQGITRIVGLNQGQRGNIANYGTTMAELYIYKEAGQKAKDKMLHEFNNKLREEAGNLDRVREVVDKETGKITGYEFISDQRIQVKIENGELKLCDEKGNELKNLTDDEKSQIVYNLTEKQGFLKDGINSLLLQGKLTELPISGFSEYGKLYSIEGMKKGIGIAVNNDGKVTVGSLIEGDKGYKFEPMEDKKTLNLLIHEGILFKNCDQQKLAMDSGLVYDANGILIVKSTESVKSTNSFKQLADIYAKNFAFKDTTYTGQGFDEIKKNLNAYTANVSVLYEMKSQKDEDGNVIHKFYSGKEEIKGQKANELSREMKANQNAMLNMLSIAIRNELQVSDSSLKRELLGNAEYQFRSNFGHLSSFTYQDIVHLAMANDAVSGGEIRKKLDQFIYGTGEYAKGEIPGAFSSEKAKHECRIIAYAAEQGIYKGLKGEDLNKKIENVFSEYQAMRDSQTITINGKNMTVGQFFDKKRDLDKFLSTLPGVISSEMNALESYYNKLDEAIKKKEKAEDQYDKNEFDKQIFKIKNSIEEKQGQVFDLLKDWKDSSPNFYSSYQDYKGFGMTTKTMDSTYRKLTDNFEKAYEQNFDKLEKSYADVSKSTRELYKNFAGSIKNARSSLDEMNAMTDFSENSALKSVLKSEDTSSNQLLKDILGADKESIRSLMNNKYSVVGNELYGPALGSGQNSNLYTLDVLVGYSDVFQKEVKPDLPVSPKMRIAEVQLIQPKFKPLKELPEEKIPIHYEPEPIIVSEAIKQNDSLTKLIKRTLTQTEGWKELDDSVKTQVINEAVKQFKSEINNDKIKFTDGTLFKKHTYTTDEGDLRIKGSAIEKGISLEITFESGKKLTDISNPKEVPELGIKIASLAVEDKKKSKGEKT